MSIIHNITHMVRPGRTTTASIESGNLQTTQVRHSPFEVAQTNSMQIVGLASALPIGTDVMKLNVGGDNSNGVLVASNNQTYRPKNLATGETILYDCSATQQSVYLKADGTIVVTSTNTVIINAPNVVINGSLTVNGAIHSTGDNTANTVSLEHHTHKNSGGTGNSGTPN